MASDQRGISSLISGLAVAILLGASVAAVIILPSLQKEGAPSDETQAKLREDLSGTITEQNEENFVFTVLNTGDIELTVIGVSRRYGDRIETTSIDHVFSPNEERTIRIDAGSFDAVGVLTSRGNLFPILGVMPEILTIIEGIVLDNETGDPVGGAEVSGSVSSELTPIDLIADENGNFRVSLPRDLSPGMHTFALRGDAPGYENTLVMGILEYGDTFYVQIDLHYDPFDVELTPASDSLTRSWFSSTTYTSSSTSTSITWGGPYKYMGPDEDDAVREVYEAAEGWKVEDAYTPEEYISGYGQTWVSGYYTTVTTTWYETEPYKVLEWVEKPVYKTETYISGWTVEWIDFGFFSFPFPTPVYSTRQVYAGTQGKWVTRTYYNVVKKTNTSQEWVGGYWATDYSSPVYSTRQVLSGYDIYRAKSTTTTSSHYATDYSPQSWSSVQATVTVTPKNGYENLVQLESAPASGIQAQLDSAQLTFSSPAQTTLTLTPYDSTSGGSYPVSVKASDAGGRSVETQTYNLNLTSSKPAAYSWSASSTSYEEPSEEPEEPEEPEPPEGETRLTIKTVNQNGDLINGPIYLGADYKGTRSWTGEVLGGSYWVSFGPLEGYAQPEGEVGHMVSVRIAVGEHKTVTGVYTSSISMSPSSGWVYWVYDFNWSCWTKNDDFSRAIYDELGLSPWPKNDDSINPSVSSLPEGYQVQAPSEIVVVDYEVRRNFRTYHYVGKVRLTLSSGSLSFSFESTGGGSFAFALAHSPGNIRYGDEFAWVRQNEITVNVPISVYTGDVLQDTVYYSLRVSARDIGVMSWAG